MIFLVSISSLKNAAPSGWLSEKPGTFHLKRWIRGILLGNWVFDGIFEVKRSVAAYFPRNTMEMNIDRPVRRKLKRKFLSDLAVLQTAITWVPLTNLGITWVPPFKWQSATKEKRFWMYSNQKQHVISIPNKQAQRIITSLVNTQFQIKCLRRKR